MSLQDHVTAVASDAEYRNSGAVTGSGFLALLKSPLHWKQHQAEKQEDPGSDDSRDKAMGRLFHRLALEPGKPVHDFAVETEPNPNRRAGEYQTFKKQALAQGKAIVTMADRDYAKTIADRVVKHLPESGTAEAAVFAEHKGVKIACRFDKVCGDEAWSLKSTEDLEGYDRQYNNLQEYWKDAFYAFVAGTATGKAVWQTHVVIEKKPPHDIGIRRFPLEDTEAMRERMMLAIANRLELLGRCQASNTWPGLDGEAPRLRDLRLEKWAVFNIRRAC